MPTGRPVSRRDQLDELDQPVDVGERGVCGWADAVLADRYAANGPRSLGSHLDAGEQSSESRLGALGQLDLDRAHRRLLHTLAQPLEAEAALRVAAAEVPSADLEDQLSAVAMRAREAALTRVLQAAGELARRG